jgi:diguanylate cyclase (GGDEF)-like protein
VDPRLRATDQVAAARRAELEQLRYFIVAMFAAGALIPAITLAFEPASPAQTIGFAAIAVAMAASGLVAFLVRPPRGWLFEVLALWATLLIGANIALMPTVGVMPVYLLWPVVLVAYFSSLRVLGLAYGWSMVVLSAAIAINPPSFGVSDVIVGMGSTLAIMGGIVHVVTQRHVRLRTELEVAATTDPLTGLLNRRAFLPWLEAAIERAREEGEPLSVVMLDLDHFKQINDRLGHFGGDRVLVSVAGAMRSESRAHDVLCRFGGEEVAVGLPGAGVVEARSYAARVAGALVMAGQAEGCPLTTSVGIACLSGESTVESFLHAADDALFAAKHAGRNRAAVWDGELLVDPAFGASV